jgi:hypothetical protein
VGAAGTREVLFAWVGGGSALAAGSSAARVVLELEGDGLVFRWQVGGSAEKQEVLFDFIGAALGVFAGR